MPNDDGGGGGGNNLPLKEDSQRRCNPGTSGFKANGLTPSRLTANAVFTLNMRTSLWAFSQHLEKQTHWTVVVDPDVREAQVDPVTWNGTISEILESAATAFGVKLSINEKGHVITFSRSDTP